PGAADLAAAQRGALDSGGGGVGGMLGGMLGGGAGDALKALDAFKGLGMDVDDGKKVAGVVGGFVKQNVGEGALDQALGDAGWLKALL
ncbi:MAG: hypothetical protein MI723_10095, partial [Caulobacterales bacterium]|nr:hypothetical protein [Caulobacterales bacterium]